MTITPTGGSPEYDPFNASRFAPAPAMPEVGRPTPFPKPPPLSVLAKVCIVAGVVAALGIGSLAAWGISQSSRFASIEAGKCLYLTDEVGDNQRYSTASCSSRRAVFRVDEVRIGAVDCRGEDYIRFELYSGSSDETAKSTLCLALNVETGDCLRDVVYETRVAKVRCSDITAEVRAVVRRGTAESTCSSDDTTLRYAGPPARTVCLRPTGESI